MGPLLASIALLAIAEAAPTPTVARPAFELPDDLSGKTILYIGAHPDDEWGFAPLLAQACLDRRAECRFIVVADSNSLGCLLTIGLRDPIECSTRRRVEMQKAAELFGGTVEFLGLDDLFFAFNESGKRRTLKAWDKSAGGHDALVSRMSSAIGRAQPDIVFTFDPRHGSSCHAGHRASAVLALDAIAKLPEADRPQVWLEQTSDLEEHGAVAKGVIEAGGYFAWPETEAETVYFDANQRLSNGQSAFEFMVAERKIHASQVPDEASGKRVIDPAQEWRFAPLSPLHGSVDEDFCTRLHLDRPTLDTKKGRALVRQLMNQEP